MSATDYKAADDGAVTSESAPPMMVHVVAPSSLPEGYTFEANLNNDPERTFTVEVVSIFFGSTLWSCIGKIYFVWTFLHIHIPSLVQRLLLFWQYLFEHLLIPSCSSSKYAIVRST